MNEVIDPESITAQVLKTLSQSIVAPALIELTLKLANKLSFSEGGPWKVRVLLGESTIVITHWRKHRHIPQDNPSEKVKSQFQFEWQLTITLDRQG